MECYDYILFDIHLYHQEQDLENLLAIDMLDPKFKDNPFTSLSGLLIYN